MNKNKNKEILGKQVLNQHIKRPINSFMIWAKQNRPVISKTYPELINADISIYLGMLWNSLPYEEKKIYKLSADKIKAEHLKDNPGYKYEPKSKKTNLQPTSKKRKCEHNSKANKQPTTKKSRNISASEKETDSVDDVDVDDVDVDVDDVDDDVDDVDIDDYQYKAYTQSLHNSSDTHNIYDNIIDHEEFDYYDIFQNFIKNKIY